MTLIAAYSFDSSGNTVVDDSGGSNSFSIASTGVVRTSSGHTNGGVSDSTATAATLPAIGQTSVRSIAAWIKTPTTSASTARWPLQWNVVSLGSGSWGFLFISGAINIQARNSSTFVRAAATWPTDLAWHHVLGVYDGTNVKIYLDGTLAQSTALTGPLRTDAAAPTLFGSGSADVMDDLRIYDSDESANVSTIMSTPVPDSTLAAADTSGFFAFF